VKNSKLKNSYTDEESVDSIRSRIDPVVRLTARLAGIEVLCMGCFKFVDSNDTWKNNKCTLRDSLPGRQTRAWDLCDKYEIRL